MAEGLHTATYVLNRLPTKTLAHGTPFFALYGTPPSYEHFRVFGCTCYPNLSATAPHKLSPHSTLCVFLGYSSNHKGYRCLDLSTNRILISRHVVFDETSFPLSSTPRPANELDFLQSNHELTIFPIEPGAINASPAGTSVTPVPEAPADSMPPDAAPRAAPFIARAPRTAPAGAPSSPAPRAAPFVARAPRAAPDGAPPSPASCAGPAPSKSAPRVAPMASTPAPRAASVPSTPTYWAAPTPSSPVPRAAVHAPPPPLPVSPAAHFYVRRLRPAAATPPALPQKAVPIPPVVNQHAMATRGKHGFRQPTTLVASTPPSPIPKTYRAALADPHWRRAMEEEFGALMANDTWTLVPCLHGANL